MSVGDEVTIAQFGPLELFATCSRREVFGEPGVFATNLSVSVTSSQDGWFVTNVGGPLNADDVVTNISLQSEVTAWQENDTPLTVSPSGHYLATDSALGVNIFGADCIFVGQVMAIQEP